MNKLISHIRQAVGQGITPHASPTAPIHGLIPSVDSAMQSKSEDVAGEEPSSPSESKEAEYETLKYHLLGPSLTKAGQDAVDRKKVS